MGSRGIRIDQAIVENTFCIGKTIVELAITKYSRCAAMCKDHAIAAGKIRLVSEVLIDLDVELVLL
jgi:hypothetical protein